MYVYDFEDMVLLMLRNGLIFRLGILLEDFKDVDVVVIIVLILVDKIFLDCMVLVGVNVKLM